MGSAIIELVATDYYTILYDNYYTRSYTIYIFVYLTFNFWFRFKDYFNLYTRMVNIIIISL